MELERKLVSDHLKDLEMNRYPQISKKLGRSIEELQAAVKRLGRLHPHPGKCFGHYAPNAPQANNPDPQPRELCLRLWPPRGHRSL